MRRLTLFLVAAACAPKPSAVPARWIVEGDLPTDFDLAGVDERLSAGGFAVFGDPGTGAVATVRSSSSPFARVASAEFSVAAPAICPDCTDSTCASTQRTVVITLSHDLGVDGETYAVGTSSASNFVGPTTTPPSFQVDVGDTVTLSTTGSLPSCSTFGYFFDVIGPDVPLRAFVTTATFDGTFGGAANADATCTAEASAAGLGGIWRAWLGDASPPSSRFTADGPWVRVDGVALADDLADLTDGALAAPLNLDAQGTSRSGLAWTGADATGVLGETCSGWSSAFGPEGTAGDVSANDSGWSATSLGTVPCFFSARLYCFEQ